MSFLGSIPPMYAWASGDGPVLSASASASATGFNSLTITKPAGTVENDLLIFVGTVDPQTNAWVAESGWTTIQTINQQHGSARGYYAYKLAGGAEPASYTFDTDGTTNQSGIILRVTNVNTSTPVNVSGRTVGTASGDSGSAPSVTTTASNCLLIHAFLIDIERSTLTSFALGSGQTEYDTESQGTDPGTSVIVTTTDGLKTSPGATTARTASNDAADNATYLGVTVAVAPPA